MTPREPAKLGILMLDTRFPRIPGDVGNPATWDFPVEFAVVESATPHAIICEDTGPFIDAFVAEGTRLVRNGCAGIATSCGFLTLMRSQLAARLGVPVAASALEQAGQVKSMLAPDQRLAVLTISKRNLTSAHLAAAGVPKCTAIAGVEDTRFGAAILENAPDLDIDLARRELVEAAKQMVQDELGTGAILLECTNMAPYAPDIRVATGLPVYSIYTYLTWFHASLSPRVFPKA